MKEQNVLIYEILWDIVCYCKLGEDHLFKRSVDGLMN